MVASVKVFATENCIYWYSGLFMYLCLVVSIGLILSQIHTGLYSLFPLLHHYLSIFIDIYILYLILLSIRHLYYLDYLSIKIQEGVTKNQLKWLLVNTL